MKKVIVFVLLIGLMAGCQSRPTDDQISAVVDNMVWLQTRRVSSFGLPSLRLVSGGQVMYFDPGSLDFSEQHPEADIIFITHNDKDHMNPNTVRSLRNAGTILVTNAYTGKYFRNDFDDEHLIIVEPGEALEINGIPVEVVPMYRPQNSRLHPQYRGYTGYILNLDGVRMYFSGSVGLMDELNSMGNIDIACMNVRGMIYTGGTDDGQTGGGGHDAFSLDKQEALDAIRILKPKVFYPIYWMPSMRPDTEYIADHAPAGVEVVIRPPWD